MGYRMGNVLDVMGNWGRRMVSKLVGRTTVGVLRCGLGVCNSGLELGRLLSGLGLFSWIVVLLLMMLTSALEMMGKMVIG